jgi:FlaA1/EpsC-like NDP-sugar epimerase
MGSRGSIIPFFQSLKDQKELPITDIKMTRFMISLDQCVEFVLYAFKDMVGGEIYVKKIPSIKIVDIAKVITPLAKYKIIGIRPGEKLHEQMIGSDDSHFTYEYSKYYKILPQIYEWGKDRLRINNGNKVPEGFVYSSDKNKEWMTKSDLQIWINSNQNSISKI